MNNEANITETFSDEEIQLTVTKKPHCQIEFLVKTPFTLMEIGTKKAIREVAKKVSIPGFRKGKAPDLLILKHYKGEVDRAAQEKVADEAFKKAQNLAKVPVLQGENPISFKVEKSSPTDGVELSFHFESEPYPPSIDPKKLPLKPPKKKKITKKETEKTLDELLSFYASWEEVNDRMAEEGDFVLLDLEALENDPPMKVFSDHRFEISKEKMAEWMRELTIGLAIGESKEGISRPDKEAPEDEKKNYEPKKVRLTLKGIQKRVLPPLDDAFASKLGVESMDELKTKLPTILEKREEQRIEEEFRRAINRALLDTFPLDLPHSLLSREKEYRMKELSENKHFYNQWQQMSEEERKEKALQIETEAKEALSLFYLCRSLVEQEKLSLEEKAQEALSPLESLLGVQGGQGAPSEAQKGIAFSRLVLTKAQDFIIKSHDESNASKPQK